MSRRDFEMRSIGLYTKHSSPSPAGSWEAFFERNTRLSEEISRRIAELDTLEPTVIHWDVSPEIEAEPQGRWQKYWPPIRDAFTGAGAGLLIVAGVAALAAIVALARIGWGSAR